MSVAEGWVEFEDLREFVRAHLGKAPQEALKPHWDTILNPALTSAYWTIISALLARGFTKAQADEWDRGEEFQRDIAAWIALKRLAVIHPDSVGQQNLTELDRRPELRGDKDTPAVAVTIDGVIVAPDGTYGQPNVGPMNTTEDLFVMDPDDVRIGQPTKW